MEHTVSVIVPVYNAEQTIEKCVESLALGRIRDLEITLIDDCSTDGSWQCCQALAKRFSQVRCVRNETNRGVSFSRNKGLDQASGEYVLFVDSDDWVSEHYVQALLDTAREHPDALVVCGLHFLNTLEDYRRTYLWEPAGTPHAVAKADFFELHRRFLLPQVWNKIFRRDVIEDHHLRFDESQSMGEDFQFVLDYLEAARIESCTVCNRPLYYYTRRNTHTLMNTFGHTHREAEYARYARLRDLTGATEQYAQALERLDGSFVYHCLRNSRESRKKQLEQIREIVPADRAESCLRQLQITKVKETIVLTLRAFRQTLAVKWGDHCRAKNQRLIYSVRRKLENAGESVTILSQNCIGGVFYRDMGLQFVSPTIGLFIKSKDFVRFICRMDDYLSQNLMMRWGEEYPIGRLGDIEIHFMHYDNCRLAEEAWLRRCARIRRDRIVLLCTDRDGFDSEDFRKWTALPYPKVLFTAKKAYRNHPDSVYFGEFRKQGCVGDLIEHRKFYRANALVDRIRKMNEE